MNLAMSRSDSEKRTLVCPMVGFVRRHSVSVSKLPVDFSVKIGEGLPHVCIKITYASLVWRLCPAAWCDLQNHVRTVLRRHRISLCLELPRCCGAQSLSLHQRRIFGS